MSRNLKVEQELHLLGIEFEFVKNYRVDRIDWKEAEANEARLTRALDVDRCVAIALKMEAGADWEAITVRHDGGPSDQLINGRHACAALGLCKPARTTIDAIVVRTVDPHLTDLLIRSSNIPNGRETTHQEKLIHIAEHRRLVPNATIKSLAATFGMKPHTVAEYLKALAAEKRADELGMGHVLRTRVFSDEIKRRLNTLPDNQVFVRAAQLIAKFPLILRGQAASEFVTALYNSPSEARRLKIIDQRDAELSRAEASAKVRKPRQPTPKTAKFLNMIKTWTELWPGTVEKVDLEGYTWEQLKRQIELWDTGMDYLIDLRARGQALVERMRENEDWRRAQEAGRDRSDSVSLPL